MAAPTSREALLTAEATPCFSGGVPLMMAAVAGAVHSGVQVHLNVWITRRSGHAAGGRADHGADHSADDSERAGP